MTQPEIRKPWHRERVQHPGGGESMTDRSFGNDTDVNNIVARFQRTGELPKPPPGAENPIYDDVTELQCDLTEMISKTQETRETLQQYFAKQKEAKADQAKSDQEELARLRQQVAELSKADPAVNTE